MQSDNNEVNKQNEIIDDESKKENKEEVVLDEINIVQDTEMIDESSKI